MRNDVIVFYPATLNSADINYLTEHYKNVHPFVTEEDVMDSLYDYHLNDADSKIVVLEDEAIANNCLCEFATFQEFTHATL